MKNYIKYLIAVFLFLEYIPANSQLLLDDEFQKFYDYFENMEEIPKSLFYNVSKQDFDDRIVAVDAVQILNKYDDITLIVEKHYPESGYCSSFEMLVFSIFGELKNVFVLGYNALDLYGGSSCEIQFLNNTLLEIIQRNIKIEGGDNEIEVVVDSLCSYYLITNNDVERIIPKYSRNRIYSVVSQKVLSKNELLKFENEELDIMRNEIYADYGYVFKSSKWSSYFETQQWYVAKSNNVNNFLTEIEKINVARILEIKKTI